MSSNAVFIDPLYQDSVWEPSSDIRESDLTALSTAVRAHIRTHLTVEAKIERYLQSVNSFGNDELVQTLLYDHLNHFDKMPQDLIKYVNVIDHPHKKDCIALFIQFTRAEWTVPFYKNQLPQLFKPPSRSKLSSEMDWFRSKLHHSKKIGYRVSELDYRTQQAQTEFLTTEEHKSKYNENQYRLKKTNQLHSKATLEQQPCYLGKYDFIDENINYSTMTDVCLVCFILYTITLPTGRV